MDLKTQQALIDHAVSEWDFPADVAKSLSKIIADKEKAKANLLKEAARAYDTYRHDPDSVGFDDSYVGPSELELGGGCNRCGSPDDCYCNG